jgi:hypothetical protein
MLRSLSYNGGRYCADLASRRPNQSAVSFGTAVRADLRMSHLNLTSMSHAYCDICGQLGYVYVSKLLDHILRSGDVCCRASTAIGSEYICVH